MRSASPLMDEANDSTVILDLDLQLRQPSATHYLLTSDSHGQSRSPGVVVTDNMLALVDAFFDTLYPLPSYSFLHPATTMKQCRDGQMHRSLASAICAVTAFHLGHHKAAASRWTQDAEQSIWMRLESPTIPLLQALLLVIYYRMESGNFQRAFMLTATAARFAAALRLNHERPGLDPISMETRRRTVWSLKIVERYFSVGLPEFELCPTEAIYLNYPVTEEEYKSGLPGEERGACGLHCKLEVVRRNIMKLTRALSTPQDPLPSALRISIDEHQRTLSEIGSFMPNGTRLSSGQITDLLESENPWFSRLLAMHISWHQAHCDLYRLLIPGYPEAAPSAILDQVSPADIAFAEQQCLEHASSAIDILTTANYQSTARHFFEFDIAICAYHATRLLLFLSRHGGKSLRRRPTPEFAVSRAELCLVALRRFYPSSLLVAPMIKELNYSIGVFSRQRQQQQDDECEMSSPCPSLYARSGPVKADSGQGSSAHSKGGRDTVRLDEENPAQRLAVHSLLRQTEFLTGEQTTPPSDLASAEELSVQLTPANKVAGALNSSDVGLPTAGHLTPQNEDVQQEQHETIQVESAAGIVTPVSMPMHQSYAVNTSQDGRDFEDPNSYGELGYPLFSLCGPEDWEWLFTHEQWPT